MHKSLHLSYYSVWERKWNRGKSITKSKMAFNFIYYRRKVGGTRFLLLLDVNQKPIYILIFYLLLLDRNFDEVEGPVSCGSPQWYPLVPLRVNKSE